MNGGLEFLLLVIRYQSACLIFSSFSHGRFCRRNKFLDLESDPTPRIAINVKINFPGLAKRLALYASRLK